jgi:hypothetical protein
MACVTTPTIIILVRLIVNWLVILTISHWIVFMKMQWLGKLHTVDKEAMKIIKQKRMFNLDQFSFATEDIKDAQNTMTVMKSANNKLWKIAR